MSASPPRRTSIQTCINCIEYFETNYYFAFLTNNEVSREDATKIDLELAKDGDNVIGLDVLGGIHANTGEPNSLCHIKLNKLIVLTKSNKKIRDVVSKTLLDLGALSVQIGQS